MRLLSMTSIAATTFSRSYREKQEHTSALYMHSSHLCFGSIAHLDNTDTHRYAGMVECQLSAHNGAERLEEVCKIFIVDDSHRVEIRNVQLKLTVRREHHLLLLVDWWMI